jgi:hypothetical protein
VFVGAGGSGAATRPVPKLVLALPTPIQAFAADGSRLAWIRKTSSGCAVYVRAGGRMSSSPVTKREFCPSGETDRRLALAGQRTLWSLSTAGRNNQTLVETALTGAQARTVRQLEVNPAVHGDSVTGVAADGSTLVYGVDSFTCIEQPDSTVDCAPAETDVSGAWLVGPTGEVRVQTAPVSAVAVAGRLVALVPTPVQGVPRTVEVRRLPSVVVKRVAVARRILAVAMSSQVLVVESVGLNLFQPRTGRPLGRVSVPSGSLAVSGNAVVVTRSKTIRLVDVRTKRVSVLARRKLPPIGVTIEGRRVLWAENSRRGGRIYSLALPG